MSPKFFGTAVGVPMRTPVMARLRSVVSTLSTRAAVAERFVTALSAQPASGAARARCNSRRRLVDRRSWLSVSATVACLSTFAGSFGVDILEYKLLFSSASNPPCKESLATVDGYVDAAVDVTPTIDPKGKQVIHIERRPFLVTHSRQNFRNDDEGCWNQWCSRQSTRTAAWNERVRF